MVLELAVSKKISDFSSSLQIFSDSQSAVGILTLNWASTNFTVLISQIKSLLNQLQSTAFEVSIHWTPGHATIAGNEIADRLAKDAAQQASKMPMDTSVVTSQDIKSAAKKSIISKWQQRWDISETGRFLYTFKPLVDGKLYLDLPSKDLFPIIHQLRTGYCKLNEYRFKVNQCESLECDCGEIETVQHFLLECPLYEEERDQLLKNLFSQLGINFLDMDLLLGYSENENIPGWRESIINELGQYLARTGRLFSRVSAELLMGTYHNNPLTVSNTKSLKYICGNFTFEALNLHREKSTLEKIVPQCLIPNMELLKYFSLTADLQS